MRLLFQLQRPNDEPFFQFRRWGPPNEGKGDGRSRQLRPSGMETSLLHVYNIGGRREQAAVRVQERQVFERFSSKMSALQLRRALFRLLKEFVFYSLQKIFFKF